MPRIAPLDLRIAPEAKARMLSFLSSITEYEATLCLTKGWTDKDSEERWMYGAYGPDNIKHVAPELESRGHALLYQIEDLTVAIPQFQYLAELEGKTLGLGRKGLVVLSREPGI